MKQQYQLIANALGEYNQRYSLKRPFSLADTGVSHRLITYWDEKKLLPSAVDSQKWRKFSIEELVWIRLIARLRHLNVGLKTLASIKDYMFEQISLADLYFASKEIQETTKQFLDDLSPGTDLSFIDTPEFKKDLQSQRISFLSYLIKKINAIHQPVHFLFAVIPREETEELEKVDDAFLMTPFDPYAIDLFMSNEGFRKIFLKTHISISFNELVSDVFLNASPFKLGALIQLTPQENLMLECIRSQKYCTVTIQFNENREPTIIEVTEERKVNTESRLLDLIHNNGYHEIIVKTQAGKIVNYKNTRKIKLQK